MEEVIDLTNEHTFIDLASSDSEDQRSATMTESRSSFFDVVLNGPPSSVGDVCSMEQRRNHHESSFANSYEEVTSQFRTKKNGKRIKFCQTKLRFELTKNITCRYMEEMEGAPIMFNCHKHGYGTLIENSECLDDDSFWGSIQLHCLSIIRRHKTCVHFDEMPCEVDNVVKE